jgi:glycosyltransferase involved in cell wall biosynthesis
MRPLKIAVLRSKEDSSYRVRCHAPLMWLQRQRAIEVVPPLKAWEADVVLLHGQWQPGAVAVARSLRRHGIRVVADLDEDIFNAPAEHPSAALYRDPALQARCRELLGAVDAVFVPTDHLASRLASLSSRISVSPSGIDLEGWRQAPKPKACDRVQVVGFAGTTADSASLEILRPVLAKLSGKFKEQGIRFVCFGLRPSWLSGVMADAEVVEACGPEVYPIRLATLAFDVALAPLSNSIFDKSRPALKFWEYTAAGAATVASNVDPYNSAIQHGSTGLLADKQAEAWTQAILKLIRNHDLRAQLLESARRSVEAHDVSRTAPAMLEALESTEPNRLRELFSFPRTQTQACPDVDVVIPIYNSPELTEQAIEAALPELDARHRLILVDDASPDPAVGSLLEKYASRPWVTVHRAAQNSGFVGTCNLAVQQLVRPDADVILMNSDTRPMPGFVRRLAETAGSNPSIGTVTAVSNQGWIASVPDFADAKELTALEHPLVLSPTACGFLFYIKRQVIRKYGLFDPAFSPGYCEELDLSLRISPEYVSVIDSGCWTWHANSVSFGDTKYKLSADHNAIIDQRYPNFRFELAAFNAGDPLRAHRMSMLRATRDPRPRVLHVLQSIGSNHGTGKHVRDLSENLSGQFLSLAAAPNEARDPAQERLELSCGEVAVGAWPYSQPGWPQTAAQLPANEEAWTSLLDAVKPNVIHLHHAKNHTLSLLARLTGTGVPVIVSVHDYFFLCPDFALQQCPGLHCCDTCFPVRFKGPAEYQRLRRALFYASLKQASAIIAPSQTAARMVREVYPDLNVLVIPHGIRPIPKLARDPGSKIRFGMLGNVNAVKGIEVILRAWPLVAPADGAELHIFGESTNPTHVRLCTELGIHYHGPYAASDLPRILSQIDVGVLPSQAPETFSYALSEFFAGGVAVIGSDFGALSERIENGVNGFKIVKDDVRSWASVLSRLIQDGDLRDRIRRGVMPPESVSDMSAHYANLYRDAIANAERRAENTVRASLRSISPGITELAARP